ncbi:MAG: inorganic phosphate transporter [Sulfolobales archaeon]
MDIYEMLLVLTACFFAASMGYHYAGAIVGPAYGGKAISLKLGLMVSALLVIIGSLATPVIYTYIKLAQLDNREYLSSLLASAIATTIATYIKVPTSTIQIFAFSVIGSAVMDGKYIEIPSVFNIISSWVLAPSLSYLLAPVIRKVIPNSVGNKILILTMCYSALVLGLNDVSNAASPMIGAGLDEYISRFTSGALMGAGLMIWGSRLARFIGREIGISDIRSFLAAHITKATILTALNTLGLNASMNQTLIGALAGIGVEKKVITRIIAGWIYSPMLGFTLSVVFTAIVNII